MILWDTSAVYALANDADQEHDRAIALAGRLAREREELVLHSYILCEAAALLQRRLGLGPALRFLREAQALHVHWVSQSEHRLAVELLEQEGRRGLSLVDCVSFVVMRLLGVDTAFAFDADFQQMGFRLYGP